MSALTTLERAFELARSGKMRTVAEIRMRLKSEGYDPEGVQGRGLMLQLKKIIKEAAAAPQTIAQDQIGVGGDNRK